MLKIESILSEHVTLTRTSQVEITQEEIEILAMYMDNDVRERVHSELAPCTPTEFLKRYLIYEPGFSTVVKNVIDVDVAKLFARANIFQIPNICSSNVRYMTPIPGGVY